MEEATLCCTNNRSLYADRAMSDDHDSEPYGYDPAKRRGRAMRDLFERMEANVEAKSPGPQQIAKAAKVPKLSLVKKRLLDAHVKHAWEAVEEISYQHTVLCQTALPVRRPPESVRIWEQQQGRAALSLEAGRACDPNTQKFVNLPLPFGPKARLVLMYLNSEAIKQQSPVIEVEDSMTAFVRRLMSGSDREERGRDPNGREIRAFKEQLGALSAALVRLAITDGMRPTQVDTKIVDTFDLWFSKDEHQRVLWPSTVELSPRYFDSLCKHAVPLAEWAIASLAHSATALDVYAWLAQRLHRIPVGKPQFIAWKVLHEQFGQGFGRIRDFRRKFLTVLRQVRQVYPQAQFQLDDEGLTLCNSPPPVLKRAVLLSPPTIDLKPL